MAGIDPLKAGMPDFSSREVTAISAHAKEVLNGAAPALSPSINIQTSQVQSSGMSGHALKSALLYAPIGVCGALAVSHVTGATGVEDETSPAARIRQSLTPGESEGSTSAESSRISHSRTVVPFCSALSTLLRMTH